ncbi:hypothetical protein [Paraburkholderia sp. SIMBA_054]|uniref:hypothetical protein n=1 Tax=Paraburkholderia TaxID=1822464 RepID=UPI0039796142
MNVFSEDRLYSLFDELEIPSPTRKRILDSFRRPARDLQPNRYQAPLDMPCPKMGLTIHVANGVERKAANSYLFDDEVLGYLDSPFELNVRYQGRGGKPVCFNWTQGFLVWTASAIYLDEWFTLDSLNSKCKNNPVRFKREDTIIRCPPLEEAASKLKLTYRVRIAEEIDSIADRNMNFLRSYLVDGQTATPGFVRKADRFFEHVSFATLEELRSALPEHGVDDFYVAIATGAIVADFSSAFVCENHRFMVFRDVESSKVYKEAYQCEHRLTALGLSNQQPDFSAGTRLILCSHAFTVAVSGNLDALLMPDDEGEPIVIKTAKLAEYWKTGGITIVSLPRSDGDALYLDTPWRYATIKAIKNAVDKLDLLGRWEDGDRSIAVTEAYSDRTYRTLRKVKYDALHAGEDVLAAFLPKWPDRGNRRRRLSDEVEKIIKEIFDADFESLRGPNKWFVFGRLSKRLKTIGESISKVTFLRRVAKETDVNTIRQRAGAKAAYQASGFAWILRHDTPIHGDYPMQYVHIDHTELEIEVVSKKTGEPLGRPILTLIICAYSRRILGFYLSLRKPRYLSCMAAFLDMIRRFGRAPEFVIFDGGSEFGAADFKWLLRFLGTGEKPRKTSACREGDVIERIFGVSQAAFIHNLFGNTKLRRNPRGLTEETDPTNLARHTLEELYDGLARYLFETYDKRRHGTLCMSPRQKFEMGLDRSGERLGRLRRIKDCIPLAFPSVRGATRKIDYQRGIRTNLSRFRNPRLESPQYHRLSVPVKMHPIDPNVAYAFVDHEWYPLQREKSDADASSTDPITLAEFEENFILHSRTLASQSEANIEVADIVEDMDGQCAERVNGQRNDSEAAEPSDESQKARVSNDGIESDSDDLSLEQQLRVLRERGYHAQTYRKP